MDLRSVWVSINDKCWPIAEALRLGDFFDKHNIPPVIIPIALLLVITLVLFLLLAPIGQPIQTVSCGDGICGSDEDVFACPEDCAPSDESLKALIVKIEGDVEQTIAVSVEDSEGRFIEKSTGQTNEFRFADFQEESVIVFVRNPANGKSASPREVPLRNAVTTIAIDLPEDFFDDTSPPAKGTLRIFLKDAVTGSPVSGTVSVLIVQDASTVLFVSEQVQGAASVPVDAGKFYAITVQASGYEVYSTRSNPVAVEPGQQSDITALLQPVGTTRLATLRVCVTDLNGTTPYGFLQLLDLTGQLIAEDGIIGGCAEFETTTGTYIVSTDLLGMCPDTNAEVLLVEGENSIDLTVSCLNEGRARVKLLGEDGNVLTANATITAWYPDGTQIYGTNPDKSLSVGSDGFTEFILVDSSLQFYFMVTNLSGYDYFVSPEYAVEPGENLSIELTLEELTEPQYNFTFTGILFPNPVGPGRNFTVSVSQIFYGSTDITSFAEVSMAVAGASCSVDGTNAICRAPSQPGDYDLVISADYGGRIGVEIKDLSVLPAGNADFQLIQHALPDTQSPITLVFDILLNDTLLDSLTESAITVYYKESDYVVADGLEFTGSGGTYSFTVSAPFLGEHRAEIYLMKVKDGIVYEQSFTLYFDAYGTGMDLDTEQALYPRILEPAEAYMAYIRIEYGGGEIAGLQDVYVEVAGQRSLMSWNPAAHAYEKALVAPSPEGKYDATFYLGYYDIALLRFYVVDTSKTRAPSCAIDDCSQIAEVRKCVYEYKYEDLHTESQTMTCIENGWFIGDTNVAHCLSSSANRGDWDNDCSLTDEDASIMEDFLDRITYPSERNSYAGCGDMDNDDAVDDSDLACLANVLSGKWYGDTESSPAPDDTCASEMKGAFCFDIEIGLPGDFNGDDLFSPGDSEIMDNITSTVSAGVSAPAELLAVADFNQDGAINDYDETCLAKIISGPIPADCLKAFDFGCSFVRGDLNTDGEFSDVDLLLERWILDGRVTANICADLDEDGLYTQDDYECLSALVIGDSENIEEFCTPCIDEQTAFGRYGEEVCNDAEDNDCDGEVDEDCSCGESTPCEQKWDIDSIPDTDDFKYCVWTSWGGWGWKTEQELRQGCEDCSDVGEEWSSSCEPESVCIAKCDGEVAWYSPGYSGYDWVETFESNPATWSCGAAGYFMNENTQPGQLFCCDKCRGELAEHGCGSDLACGACPGTTNPLGVATRKIATTYDCAACCISASICSGCQSTDLSKPFQEPDCALRGDICLSECTDRSKTANSVQCYSTCMSAVGCSGEPPVATSCGAGKTCAIWTVYSDSSCTTVIHTGDGSESQPLWHKLVCMPITWGDGTLDVCGEDDNCCHSGGWYHSTTPAFGCQDGVEIIVSEFIQSAVGTVTVGNIEYPADLYNNCLGQCVGSGPQGSGAWQTCMGSCLAGNMPQVAPGTEGSFCTFHTDCTCGSGESPSCVYNECTCTISV